jgi:hypothetical protein
MPMADLVVHFPRGASWASLLLRARAAGRLDSALMWEVLLAHADDVAEPDVASLLMHLPWPDEAVAMAPAPPREPRASSDEFVLMEDGLGAA